MYLQILFCSVVCIFVIISYGTYRCKTTDFVDPLTKSFFGPPLSNYLDGWGITHFLFFAFLGYTFNKPQYLIFAFILGVLWEIIEFSLKDKPFYVSNCKYKAVTNNGEGWWYVRYEDITMNTIGLLFGYYISSKKLSNIKFIRNIYKQYKI